MAKPRILVTGAAGRTAAAAVQEKAATSNAVGSLRDANLLVFRAMTKSHVAKCKWMLA